MIDDEEDIWLLLLVLVLVFDWTRHWVQNECMQPTSVLPLVIGSLPQMPHC